MLLSVHAWTLCRWRKRNCFSLDSLLCTCLESLILEDSWEALLSVHTWTLCWWRALNCFSLCVPGFIAGGREGIASLWTPWTLCWWRTWRRFSLYEPGLSASGGQGNASLCTYLDSLCTCLVSLLVEDRGMLLSAHAWTLCWWRTRNCFSVYVPGLTAGGGQGDAFPCVYLGSLLMEDTQIVLSVHTWVSC